MEVVSAFDTVVFLANWALKVILSVELKDEGAVGRGTPTDLVVFIYGLVHGEISKLFVFSLCYTVFDVLVAHLFLTSGFRAEDREFELVDLLFDVLLEALFVENVVTDSQRNDLIVGFLESFVADGTAEFFLGFSLEFVPLVGKVFGILFHEHLDQSLSLCCLSFLSVFLLIQ